MLQFPLSLLVIMENGSRCTPSVLVKGSSDLSVSSRRHSPLILSAQLAPAYFCILYLSLPPGQQSSTSRSLTIY